MEYKGKIKTGFGNAAFWVNKICKIFEEKYGIKLFLGTLNVELDNEIILENAEKILASEYGGNYDVLIKECKIFGDKAYIVRTEKNNGKNGDHKLNIIEIVSNINMRDTYKIKDNDIVTISI